MLPPRPKQPSIPEFKQTPGVVFQPEVYLRMRKGIHTIVDAIRPTVGPRPRTVAVEKALREQSPELLDSGGMVARRIIDLANPDENHGAMFLRGMLWRLYERVGDGTATAALLFEALYDAGVRFVSAGGNAMLLRGFLEKGMAAILQALSTQVIPVQGKEMLTQVARTVCFEDQMAEILGEVFELIGDYGILEVRTGRGREIEREYIEGSYWPGGLHAREMMNDVRKQQVEVEEAALLITDMEINEPQQLIPALQAAVEAQTRTLVVMASKLSDSVLGLLAQSRKPGNLLVVGVKAPGIRSDEQMEAMEDIAVLTGGSFFAKAAGVTLEGLRPDQFGYARKIWANMDYLGIVGGKGSPARLRQHVGQLRLAFDKVNQPGLQSGTREEIRNRLRARVGRLSGGAATIWIGGLTETEIERRKVVMEHAASTLRAALREGVVAGGGASLLACRSVLEPLLQQSACSEETAAYRMLMNALEAPFRTIMMNAGYDSGEILAKLEQIGPDHVFDVLQERVVGIGEAGLYDVAAVQREAVFCAVSSAALALTVNVTIRRKKPPVVVTPD